MSGRPKKLDDQKQTVPVSLSWTELELICQRSLKGRQLWSDDRKQVARAAIAGAAALRLDGALGARGAALVDVPGGFRLVIQGRPEDLPALENARVWFEQAFGGSK